jgi:hypothetical protein
VTLVVTGLELAVAAAVVHLAPGVVDAATGLAPYADRVGTTVSTLPI